VFSLAASMSFSLMGINFEIGILLYWFTDVDFSLEIWCLLSWKLTHWKSYEIPTTTALTVADVVLLWPIWSHPWLATVYNSAPETT